MRSSPVIEVAWDLVEVRRSLRLLAELGKGADTNVANVVGHVFTRTENLETRRLSLTALSRIGTEPARAILARIHDSPETEPGLRARRQENLIATDRQPRLLSDAILASSHER